jgi:hypothetical protein
MAELCARYGVSRKTGYKWLARYDGGGRPALRERSHAPHGFPHRTPEAVAELLCAAREAHPTGAPPSSSIGCARGTRASPGRPSAPRAISWPGAAW